ncbi:MAG: hypothetical protein IJ875_06865 [Solobacterium sp.]|nr:hypothetical protein [Solobacterium sp.]
MKKKLGMLQQEQIEIGLENGLAKEVIALYGKPCFNFLQMQEMRIALESGIPPQYVKKHFKKRIGHEEMERMRKEYEPKEKAFSLKPYYAMFIASIALVIALLGYAYYAISHPLEIIFTQDEVILQQNDPFIPTQYIAEYTEGAKLKILHEPDTSILGEQIAVYCIEKGRNSCQKSLHILVKEKGSDIDVLMRRGN